jgi:hypothetical protein
MNTRSWLWLVFSAAVAALSFLTACSEQPASDKEVASSAEPLLIEPNAAVGPIRAGMTTQQVVAAIGEPARRTANALVYPKLGLAVMPGPDGKAQVVMCGDVTGLQGPFVKTFRGKTATGLGMESSRQDIITAFGEPTEAETFRGGQEALRYADQGITFTLQRGKVHHMIVRLRATLTPSAGPGPETNAVAVDLAPPR